MLQDLIQQYPVEPSGFSVRIWLVEPDEEIAKRTIEHFQIAHQDRYRIFTGPDCVGRMLEVCHSEKDLSPPTQCTVSGQRVVATAQKIAQGLNSCMTEYMLNTTKCNHAIEARWARRGMEYWGKRSKEIAQGMPARILVMTSRYTTFLRHSAEDLVHSFRDLGHQAELLMEHDDHSTLQPSRTLHGVLEYDPDLVIVPNFPRSLRATYFPQGMPYVCWVQDAMSHLFEQVPSVPSDLDFLAGHVFKKAIGLHGYSESYKFAFPVPVSTKKFIVKQNAPEPDRKRWGDIAYVSHQSQTPDLFHADFLTRCQPNVQPAVIKCYQQVQSLIQQWESGPQFHQLEEIVSQFATNVGKEGDARVCDLLRVQYVYPLAERIIRHETLQWVTAIAENHGLVFKLFGKGWENHPGLARFASGPIAHDEQLKECYRGAGVHLHASVNGCAHQRVFECALSGGLPLCRRDWGEVDFQQWLTVQDCFQSMLPASIKTSMNQAKSRTGLVRTMGSHPAIMRLTDHRKRLINTHVESLPSPYQSEFFDERDMESYFRYYDTIPALQSRLRPIELLGGWSDHTFSTQRELEELILRYLSDPGLRTRQSQGIADRVQSQVSMDQFAKGVLDMVTSQLAANQCESTQPAEACV